MTVAEALHRLEVAVASAYQRRLELKGTRSADPHHEWRSDTKALSTLRDAVEDIELKDALIDHLQEGIKELNRVRAERDALKAEVERAKQRDLISDSVIVARLNEIKNLKEILGKTFDRAEKAEAALKLWQESGNKDAGILLHQAGAMAKIATDRCRLIAENNCLKARAEKAEADSKLVSSLLVSARKAREDYWAEWKKAEAELERVRPLIEAVEKANFPFPNIERWAGIADDLSAILRAALAYRAARGLC